MLYRTRKLLGQSALDTGSHRSFIASFSLCRSGGLADRRGAVLHSPAHDHHPGGSQNCLQHLRLALQKSLRSSSVSRLAVRSSIHLGWEFRFSSRCSMRQSCPQEDEVDCEDIEAQKQNRKSGSSHICTMEPTSGALAALEWPEHPAASQMRHALVQAKLPGSKSKIRAGKCIKG